MKPEISLRQMMLLDLPFADSLRSLAGWNQTTNDWKRWLALAPDGCFLAEWSGTPAGTGTTICYGDELAWIGMLLVHPDLRGRGIGRALLNQCVKYLRGRRIGCIKLDATPQGRLLYDKLGFKEEWSLTRWAIQSSVKVALSDTSATRAYAPSDADPIEQLDRKAFGVSRQKLLQSLLDECSQTLVHQTADGIAGYGARREGMRAHYLGPLVAASPSSGECLANALLANVKGKSIYWDIPDPNTEAVALAKNLGFTAQRPLFRMFLGANKHPGDARSYFAIADPSVG